MRLLPFMFGIICIGIIGISTPALGEVRKIGKLGPVQTAGSPLINVGVAEWLRGCLRRCAGKSSSDGNVPTVSACIPDLF